MRCHRLLHETENVFSQSIKSAENSKPAKTSPENSIDTIPTGTLRKATTLKNRSKNNAQITVLKRTCSVQMSTAE